MAGRPPGRHGRTASASEPPAGDPVPPGPPPGGGPQAGLDPGGPPPGGAPQGLDVSTAHPARVWNYWLGGRDYFAADRAEGERLSREFPHLAQAARAERAFLVRAARFLAGPARIRQFLDVGAGLPAGGNTHEIAQRIAPDAGIVYVDNDPAVLLHARALLPGPALPSLLPGPALPGPALPGPALPGLASAGRPAGRVSYVEADLRDVTSVLAGAARTLDLDRPVALIMLGVLGHIDDHGAARSITSQLMEALPPGSYLAIADGVSGIGDLDSAQQRYNQAGPLPYHLRRADQVASFFDGMELVEPGVVPCGQWKPDATTGGARSGSVPGGSVPGGSVPGRSVPGGSVPGGGGAPTGEAAVYCGVARKP